MDLHLDRQIVAKAKSELKNLYQEHLAEVDADGRQIGRDLIPWVWGLDFLATEMTVRTSLEVSTPFKFFADEESEHDEVATAKHEETIIAKVIPSDHADPHGRFPRYTMMGTDRTIKDFSLNIAKLSTEDEDESCSVWGCPAWTAEIDFRDTTIDDQVMFALAVKPSTFEGFLEQMKHGAVTQAVLRLQGVDGFYSDWSPAISTDFIKVLTTEHHQAIAPEEGVEREFPRLGKVREASLYLRNTISLPLPPKQPEPTYDDDEPDYGPRIVPPAPEAIIALTTQRIEQSLARIRIALWTGVGLLGLLVVRTLHIL